MTEQTHQPFPDQPPTEAPPLSSRPQRPTWATVIGIIAIIVASLGIAMYGLCAPIGTVSTYLMSDMIAQQPGTEASAAQMEVTMDYAPLTLTNSCALAALGVLLLVAGIGLLRMRPWSRRAMLWWAALRIAILVPSTIISWFVQRETSRAMEEALQSDGGAPPGAGFTMFFTSPTWTSLSIISAD